MSKGGRFARNNEKKPMTKKKLALILAASALAVVLAVGIIAVSVFGDMLGKINQVEVEKIQYTKPTEETVSALETTEGTVATEPHVPSSADYINFLVAGQAARAGEAERFADTMILCTLNTHTKTLTMTSMLRDSLIKMPDYKGHYGGNIKLTTIYHLGSIYGNGPAGSMELMNMTLYNNFGIEVDHNFEIDFEAFVEIVDLLGGVELEITQAEADYLNADDMWVYRDLEPGFQSMVGTEALSYARMRKAKGDNESDITRTSRQRKLVEALIGKLKNMSISDLKKMAEQVLPYITTSMSTQEITEMLLKVLPMLPELTIEQGGTCPAEYYGDMVDIYDDGMEHSVLRFDKEKTKLIMRSISEGEELPEELKKELEEKAKKEK